MEAVVMGIVYILGAMTGYALAIAVVSHSRLKGTLHITKGSEYDEPYIFLELSSLKEISEQETVHLKVDKDWTPQK